MPKVTFRVCDFETTGLKPPEAEILEIGWYDVEYDSDRQVFDLPARPSSLLFKPSGKIPVETMAIHHIRDAMVADAPLCGEKDLRLLASSGPPTFLVAHNWAMEGQWLTPEILGKVRPICTMKVAARAFQDCPSMSNQCLRYWLDLQIDDALAEPPHRAAPDAYVTGHILAEMIRRGVRVADMVRWTQEPRFMANCPLHKHKGKPWAEVPEDYLRWICTKADEMDPDIKHWAQQELERRAKLARDPALADDTY